MSKTIQGLGTYTVKETGKEQEYSFEYEQFDSLQDAVATLGEVDVLALVQRMTKVDANNTAREKAKVANGHSTRKLMTEEDKAEAKAQRASNKKLLEALKAKGINSLEELEGIL